MAVRIEDAGFEIRDMIAWVYGSGFPKSHDVSKAIDKQAGVKFDALPASGVGFMNAEGSGGYNVTKSQLVRNGESTEAAQQWEGWGTALKPALEPITVARKPLTGTVAENVLEHGTGGLNIDGCRVENNGDDLSRKATPAKGWKNSSEFNGSMNDDWKKGRWPANLIHDGSDEVVGLFPQSNGMIGMTKHASGTNSVYGDYSRTDKSLGGSGSPDKGSAARFFYCAKASKKDRDEGLEGFTDKQAAGLPMRSADGERGGEGLDGTKTDRLTIRKNVHPTVKPTDLMRYLCRLITPPNGVILDPFMGSGSTGKAAMLEGFQFIGVELENEYVKIAKARIENVMKGTK
jgi:site-specific DNA-methyltransferase (adenine-specific)